jgi:hypothetical protein
VKGVVSTRPGFLAGSEVVEVEFDPEVIAYGDLVKEARASRCATPVFTRSDRQQEIARKIVGDQAVPNRGKVKPDREPKYYLSRTELRFLPMTPLQAARVNALLRKPGHLEWLSPSQTVLLKRIQEDPEAGWKNVIGKELMAAWADLP